MIDCKVLQERGGWWEDILANRCKFPIAPINTFSNIAYTIAGIVAVAIKPNLAGLEFSLVLAFLAVGSALYHGTKRGWAAKLDDAGMYLVFTSLVVYLLSPRNHFIGPLMAFVATIVAWRLAYTTSTKDLLDPMMGVFIAISTLAVALNGSLLMALIGFGLFGIAYIIWWTDKKRTFFLPRWGHGIWHVLTAAAILTLFLGALK